MTLDDRDSALDFINGLGHQFPNDPDVLFVLVHAYSDLSTRTAQDLGLTAPDSIPAHKLNAEALEMQGRWGEAEREYQAMIEKAPNTPGLHYLLGRLLLSRPDADSKATDEATQEFEKELQIDPRNAGAEYI
ncbi:MAG: tetratricopeptide repeat protein, partial [Candidatus Acidiferrum sp.]